MEYSEFRRLLGKSGLTTREFGEIIKMNPTSISNYAKVGEVPSHLAIITALMGEMADNGLDFRAVLSRIKIKPNKPRGLPINRNINKDDDF